MFLVGAKGSQKGVGVKGAKGGATECKGYGKGYGGHKAGKGGTSTRKGAKGGKRGGKGWSDTSSQSELSSLRDVEDCEYMRIPDTAPKEVPAPSMNAEGTALTFYDENARVSGTLALEDTELVLISDRTYFIDGVITMGRDGIERTEFCENGIRFIFKDNSGVAGFPDVPHFETLKSKITVLNAERQKREDARARVVEGCHPAREQLSGHCPMPQCAKRAFAETWQLEQHCFDCHGQTRAQLMATSLNHDLEIQERRECPTCKTKYGTFWQLVKHCDEAHQSTVKDLLPRVRGLLEGVTVDDVREAPFRAKARMMPLHKSHRTPPPTTIRHGCEELAASVEEQLRRELERARETSSVHLTKLEDALEREVTAVDERDSLLLKRSLERVYEQNLRRELLHVRQELDEARETSATREQTITEERDSLLVRLEEHSERENEQMLQPLTCERRDLTSKLERAIEECDYLLLRLEKTTKKHSKRVKEHMWTVQQLKNERGDLTCKLERAEATSSTRLTHMEEAIAREKTVVKERDDLLLRLEKSTTKHSERENEQTLAVQQLTCERRDLTSKLERAEATRLTHMEKVNAREKTVVKERDDLLRYLKKHSKRANKQTLVVQQLTCERRDLTCKLERAEATSSTRFTLMEEAIAREKTVVKERDDLLLRLEKAPKKHSERANKQTLAVQQLTCERRDLTSKLERAEATSSTRFTHMEEAIAREKTVVKERDDLLLRLEKTTTKHSERENEQTLTEERLRCERDWAQEASAVYLSQLVRAAVKKTTAASKCDAVAVASLCRGL